MTERNTIMREAKERHDKMAIPEVVRRVRRRDVHVIANGVEYDKALLNILQGHKRSTEVLRLRHKPDRILQPHYKDLMFCEVKARNVIDPIKKPDFFYNFDAYYGSMLWHEQHQPVMVVFVRYINNVLHKLYACWVSDLKVREVHIPTIAGWQHTQKMLREYHGNEYLFLPSSITEEGSNKPYVLAYLDKLQPAEDFFTDHLGSELIMEQGVPGELLENPGPIPPDLCEKCGLYKLGHNPVYGRPPIPGDGSDKPEVLFVGEALGENEYKQGRPFVGESGKYLRDSVDSVDLSPEQVRYTNVVRCRPPENRPPTSHEINCCRQYLIEEINTTNPKVVVLLGGTPLKALLNFNGISAYQGTGYIERFGRKFVCAYHPSYVKRQHGNVDEDWFKAFQDILEALSDDVPKTADAHYQYIEPKSITDLVAMRDELLADPNELIAADIEALSLRTDRIDNKVISIAFANSSKAWSFPVDHKDSYWTDEERAYVQSITAEVLTKCRIINHLVKFDTKIIRHFLDIDFVPCGDTIQLSRLVSPDAMEHGLKRLAGIHLGMFDYDEELRRYVANHPECDYTKGGNYGNIPLNVLLPYGGKDVAATRMLHDVLYAKLTDKQRILYEQMIIKADYAIGLIEENGFKLDYWLTERYRAVYQAIMDTKYMPAMLEDKAVQKWIHAQGLYNKLELAGLINKQKLGKRYVCTLTVPGHIKPYTFDKNDWHGFYLRNTEKLEVIGTECQVTRKLPIVEFNPNSSQQVAPIIYEYKKLVSDPNKIALTDGGAYSVKRTVLKEVVYDMAEAGTYDQFLDDYMNWKLLSSITSKTYSAMLNPISDWYTADGRVRSTYTIGGAVTGRTSSAEPPLQNIPTPEKEPGTVLQYLPVKNAFTHTFPGGGLAMLDYSGMELRVICSIANIKGMIDVFNRKGDVHKYTSSLIYRKPESDITKFERYRGKWCNWSLLYLGNWWTLVRLYRVNGITVDEAKRIAKMYLEEAYPELPTYHKEMERFLKATGYVESVFGRRLSLPAINDSSERIRNDTLRTAVNFPIQGTASDILMMALAIITQLMRGKGYRSMFVNTVHDSLVLDYHPDERDELVALCMDVMENIVDYVNKFMPGIDFSWLRVPLVADVEYGTHYGSYGFYQPPTCHECGMEMMFAKDLHKSLINTKEELVVDYECANCDKAIQTAFEPIVYNNTNPAALYIRRQWHQVLSYNNYNGERQPRLV